jgi:hypothetical protein
MPAVQPEVNLSSDERSSRMRAALVMLGLSIGLMILLSELSLGTPWWLTVVVPLFLTSTLIVQAYMGVCPYHAKKGTRATADGTEPVLDPSKRTCLVGRGHTVMVSSLVIAVSSSSLVIALSAMR